MEKNGKTEKKTDLDRSRIAKEVFAIAESMGLRDRNRIEWLTSRVIARLEGPQPLPGMEHLVGKPARQPRHPAVSGDVKGIMQEILASETTKIELRPEPEEAKNVDTTAVKPERKATTGINLTDNARQVLEKRYLRKDKDGKVIETPEDMFRRVARAIAAAGLAYSPRADVGQTEQVFYEAITSLDFLPNSPTLMNAGRELGQLSACFVLPVEDSMEDIFNAVKYTAIIHKSGGGTGFSFSRLRPETDRVGTTGGIASGPVSFIRAFDTATDVIKQGGMRRGANMGILSVDHPDIMRFITSKSDPAALTNFNISVAVTAEFMEAVKAGRDYDLINPRNGEVAGQINAREVFNKIVDMAWKNGDPGIVFIDRINRDNPTPQLGKIESTNPCGEQPLLPYESCNLGSINLAHMVKQGRGRTTIDYARLAETVKVAIRFLDNVITVNKFPLPQIEEMTLKTRKIGLGVMGFADMLIQLGVPYNTEEGLKTAAEVMRFIDEKALEASVELAKERGVFPAFEGSIYDRPGEPRVRNASRTTIAPTGTLSIIAACSGGIEPIFALSFTKNILDGARLVEVNPYFEQAAKSGGFHSDELMQKLAGGAHLGDIEGIPERIKAVYVTAHEIPAEWHVRMQSAFQRHTDNAVSKTVNFPHDATREDVASVYMLAYQEDLKGITIYRDGSRESQVLTTGATRTETAEAPSAPVVLKPRRRAKETHGVTKRVTTGCGRVYITVNSDDQGICEVFTTLGKAGGCASAQLEAISRLISLTLRSGIDVASIVKQLRGIRCPSIAWEEGKSVLSCADAIASVLEDHIGENQRKPDLTDCGVAKNLAGQCPECSNMLVYQEGCFVCPACGYTKC